MLEGLVIKDVLNEEDILDFAYLNFLDVREYYKDDKRVTQAQRLQSALKFANDSTMHIWLAHLNKRAIGYTLGFYREDCFESMGLFVLKELRGNGIGKRLKQAQIETATILGFNQIRTWIDKDLIASQRLHESLGFKLTLANNKLGYHAVLTINPAKN